MNAVFIHNPKTAGSYTIRTLGLQNLTYPHKAKSLFRQKGFVTFGHQDYLGLLRRGIVGREFHKTAFKFTFCRNPYDRTVSHYFYTRGRHPDILPPEVSFIDFTRRIEEFNVPKHLNEGGRVSGKQWFRPQSACIRGIDIDFIGRFENLDGDIGRLAKILNIQTIPTKRMRASRHRPYQTYYNEESKDLVRRYYAEDFSRFGYDDSVLHG